MIPRKKLVLPIILLAALLSTCTTKLIKSSPSPTASLPLPVAPTNTPVPNTDLPEKTEVPSLSEYEFPKSVDPSRKYMFYLHGKIIEDQGINAISPDYGPYEFEAILEKLGSFGFVVISEIREKNSDPIEYANRVFEQVKSLLDDGVSPENITIVGASKGAGIAILVSNMVNNPWINYVLLGTCHPDDIPTNIRNNIYLTGNVLSIFDSVDEFSGSCKELFTFSEGKGLANHKEIILNVGTGHGILYKPLDDWVLPTVDWANGK